MQDFLLDFRSVWMHISEGGLLEFRELRGYEFFRASDFIILGFLNFLGYRLDGWDTEYRVDAKSWMYEGVGWHCRQYVNSKVLSNHCYISGACAEVDLRGILYSDVMKLSGELVERCLIPVDMVVYFMGFEGFYSGVKGFYIEDGDGDKMYDYTLCDEYNIDMSKYYEVVFKEDYFTCYGRSFTEWLLLGDVYNHWHRGENLSHPFSVGSALKVNKVFIQGVLSKASEGGRGDKFKEYLESFVRGCV